MIFVTLEQSLGFEVEVSRSCVSIQAKNREILVQLKNSDDSPRLRCHLTALSDISRGNMPAFFADMDQIM